MSLRKNLLKVFQTLLRQLTKLSRAITKGLMNWLLRTFLVLFRRQSRLSQAGFVLPTVVMVTIVVVLLTTALVLRSFDRSKSASSNRLSQVIQNTSTPAIDRARAKLDALLTDPNLPRGTPSDAKILQVMADPKYTFADETRLKLAYNFGNGDSNKPDTTIQTLTDGTAKKLEYDETLSTAWKYPVDTDGDGQADSYTLYGIYFRSPSRTTNNGITQFDIGRIPLQGRSLPQEITGLGSQCKTAGLTSATSVAGSDWNQIGGNLAKAFHVYAATVPSIKKGNKGFTALEYEQDRYRQGINKNAVFFQDDLILNPGADFRLNGKVLTNANLLVGGFGGAKIQFFQVSSKWSCFYEDPDNSKITVGGNVGTGNINQDTDQTAVTVDLYNGYSNPPKNNGDIDGTNKSTNSAAGKQIAYNDAAYEKRIALMKGAAVGYCNGTCITTGTPPTVNNLSQYPSDLQTSINKALEQNSTQNTGIAPDKILGDQIEIYLRNLTRRVPYAEIPAPDGTNATGSYTSSNVFSTSVVEPPEEWREPLDASGTTLKNTSVSLKVDKLPQTDPQQLTGTEINLGDRVLVGNNLPALWKDPKTGQYTGQNGETQDYKDGTKWTGSSNVRSRTTQVQALSDLGISDRNGFWETAAALDPKNTKNNNAGGGGLRVITGAGIYVDGLTTTDGAFYPRQNTVTTKGSFLPDPMKPAPNWDTKFVDPNNLPQINALKFNGQDPIIVWPDMMPMTGGKAPAGSSIAQKGDLQMRATAVYHYVDAAVADQTQQTDQTPIACVSSYYDPTDPLTAKNEKALPWNAATDDTGKSNNGIVYKFPGRDVGGKYPSLVRQARLVFPNGRFANEPLRTALGKYITNGNNYTKGVGASTNFTLADYSAVDTALCAISILDKPDAFTEIIPNGSIKEASFLDAREVKAIDQLSPSDSNYKIATNYDQPLEQRQPLEIRVTDIDVTKLAATQHLQYDSNGDGVNEQEYLLPNSGVIYATREDALSDKTDNTGNTSGTDFKLDPTRRPNGIRIIPPGGDTTKPIVLARDATTNDYRTEEKGLILVSNLPVYVKGNLNPHLPAGTTTFTAGSTKEIEEFKDTLQSDWGNFYDRGDQNGNQLDGSFACRQKQPGGCSGQGDQWRPATIISDAITLQSVNFKDGYRNYGDFDLRNNAGSPLTGGLINSGFFDNSFVTSALWWNTTGTGNAYPKDKTTDNYLSSYLTNGVTPIQRRAKVIAYQTEVCKVIPVSECANQTTQNWNTESSDTSKLAELPENERYARRVRFQNKFVNKEYRYYYDDKGYPVPYGSDISLVGSGSTLAPKDNSLWFRTRKAGITIDQEWDTANKKFQNDTYDGSQNLFIYLPPELLIRGIELGELRHYAALDKSKKYAELDSNLAPTTSLPGNDISTKSPTALPRLDTVYIALQNLKNDVSANVNPPPLDSGVPTIIDINDSSYKTIPLSGGGKLGIYNYAGGAKIQQDLTLKGDAGSIFVIIVDGDLSVGINIKVNLVDGVVAENVYWVVNGEVTLSDGSTIGGNVLASAQITIKNGSTLEGRAFSKDSGVTINQATITVASGKITAPGGNQPRLVPVLQIYSPDGSPGSANAAFTDIQGNQGKFNQLWLQQPANTNYNAALVANNSPDRPAEEGAGLHNFVRFQENWCGTSRDCRNSEFTAAIKGSFIQFKRSAYATAPFASLLNALKEGDPVVSTFPDTTQTSRSFFGYNPSGYWATNNPEPYYVAPKRQWGFDVGLLSQLPDLFSQRFVTPISKVRNYYREVGRDDAWIKTLLCAAEPANPTPTQQTGGSGATYTNYAVPDSERPPEGCPSVTGTSLPYPPNP